MGFCIVFQLKCEHNSTLLYSISPDYALKISNDLVFHDIQTPYNTHIYGQFSQAFNVGICIKVGSVVLLLYTSEQPAINRSATSTSVVHKYL